MTTIAREWRGRTRPEAADEYMTYVTDTGLSDYKKTPGCLGVIVRLETSPDAATFILTSFWDSIEAIKRFAGEDYKVARYYPKDDDFLLEREPFVAHSELRFADLDRLRSIKS